VTVRVGPGRRVAAATAIVAALAGLTGCSGPDDGVPPPPSSSAPRTSAPDTSAPTVPPTGTVTLPSGRTIPPPGPTPRTGVPIPTDPQPTS
jgi:hypothetical protein